MHSCFCMIVVVSVFASTSSAAELNVFDVADSIVAHRLPREEQSTPRSDGGKRRKRYISLNDETNIINKINSLRSSVGASNMNYLTYSYSLGNDVANWTGYCDYDAALYTDEGEEAFVIKSASRDPPQHISKLDELFKKPEFYNTFRSIHLQYVGVGSTTCFRGRVKGRYYFSQFYLTGYAFSHTSSFNENLTQFTSGKECTTCLSGSYWCDGGLCRDDCTSQMSTCSCYTSCTRCKDWNRGSCKCPSQPYTDATTLSCSARTTGGMTYTYKSASSRPCIASWIMIVLSILALFGLQ